MSNFYDKLSQVPEKLTSLWKKSTLTTPCFCIYRDQCCFVPLCAYKDHEICCGPFVCYSQDINTLRESMCIFPIVLMCTVTQTVSTFPDTFSDFMFYYSRNYSEEYMKSEDYVNFMNTEMSGYFEYKYDKTYYCILCTPFMQNHDNYRITRGIQPPPQQRFEDFKKAQIKNVLLEHAGSDQDENVLDIMVNYNG